MNQHQLPESSTRVKDVARWLQVSLIAIGAFLLIGASLLMSGTVNAARDRDPTATVTLVPEPTPTFDMSRLASPEVPEIRAQVDEGALIYWGVCMACHGDRGQGFTAEWQWGAFGEDGDCWQSGCHGSDFIEGGFEIPKELVIPPLSAAGTLGRFENAQQLYDYLVEMMPWWNPRSMGSEEAWQSTAYLLKMRGTLPAGLVLSGANASAVPVHRRVEIPQGQYAGILVFIGVLAAAMIAWTARSSIAHAVKHPSAEVPAGRRAKRPDFFAHLHAPTIPAMQARWRYTLGAGGMSVFLSLVLVLTGLLEMFYYVPTPEKAAISVQTITTFVPFGALVRNLHYWSAQFLVIAAVVHLARVIFTGAYAAPRRFNFLLGLVLLVLVVLLDFTGYVLRWDEGVRWALTAGTNLLKSVPWVGGSLYEFVVGGSTPGAAALVRFYSWHIFALSLACAVVMIWHLFRVRRDGGISTAPPAQRVNTARIPRTELLRREVLGMFVGGLALLVLSALVPAPIAPPIRSNTILEADSGAPWFFLWVQQLLRLGDPFLLGVLFPSALVVLLGAMPYLFAGIRQDELGRWFPRSGKIVQLIFTIIAVIVLALTLLSLVSTR
jgi:quinol-cytochrome oxidoreductase complex cytochrome b subunit